MQDKIADYIKDNIDVIEESVILVFVEQEVDKNVVFIENFLGFAILQETSFILVMAPTPQLLLFLYLIVFLKSSLKVTENNFSSPLSSIAENITL